LDVERTPLRFSLCGNSDAFNASGLHGQSSEVYREGLHANREIKTDRQQKHPHVISHFVVGTSNSMSISDGPERSSHSEVATAAQLCTTGPPRLLATHSAQLHTLLGLYAMSMNCLEAAEAQFNAALRCTTDRELWTFTNLNLAIVYLRMKREGDFNKLLENINPETLPSHSHSLRAAAFYVQGLQCFFQARFNEAKRYLRETLKMANAEDLNRLTSCSLVLLGHIFLSLGNSREAMNMVTPAMQLASKIPDIHIQLWASAILKDLYRMCGDGGREAEAYQMHANFSQHLMIDDSTSHQCSEHALISWVEQPLASFLQLNSNMATASTSNMMVMPAPGSSIM